MRFDAYGATVRGFELPYVASALAESLGGHVGAARGRRRYASVLEVHTGNRMAAWAGLDGGSGDIYVEAKGETTPAAVEILRSSFPEHTAPRIDVCEDYDSPGAFDRLQALIRASKGPKVKAGYVALPDDVEDGKTWSVGRRGGVSLVRLYEAGKHPDRVHMGRPDWVRAELECRPHYARDKVAAASMTPLQVWGFSAWSCQVAEALTQCPIERFTPKVRQYSHDKTTRYIFNTFRRHFEEMLANGEHIEATMRDVWREEDEAVRMGG